MTSCVPKKLGTADKNKIDKAIPKVIVQDLNRVIWSLIEALEI